jgi:hypothetical protein
MPKSSSALTNTVSVTVVPSAAVENVLRSLKSQGRISAVPLVSRAPHVIQRGGSQLPPQSNVQQQLSRAPQEQVT